MILLVFLGLRFIPGLSVHIAALIGASVAFIVLGFYFLIPKAQRRTPEDPRIIIFRDDTRAQRIANRGLYICVGIVFGMLGLAVLFGAVSGGIAWP